MVENVCKHCENHIACGRGAEAFKRDAYRHRIEVVGEAAGDYAARKTDYTADKHDYAFAELGGKRPDKRHCDSHGYRAENVYDCHCAGAVLAADCGAGELVGAEICNGKVFEHTAELEEKIEDYYYPPELVGCNGFELFFDRNLFLGGCGDMHALFGYSFTREVILQDGEKEGYHADCYERNCPCGFVGGFPPAQKPRDYHGEYHSARAHNRNGSEVGERRQKSALVAVSCRHGDEGAVCGVVQRVCHGIVEVVGDCR